MVSCVINTRNYITETLRIRGPEDYHLGEVPGGLELCDIPTDALELLLLSSGDQIIGAIFLEI